MKPYTLISVDGHAGLPAAQYRDYLERIGYYRLSGYWFAFRERSELCCALNPAEQGKHERSKPGRLPLDL